MRKRNYSPLYKTLEQDVRFYLHPSEFAGECLGMIADPWQESVLESEQDMILNCSRQSGKSTTAAVLGYHTAKYRPGSLTLLLSPSLRQSSELFRKVLENLRNDQERPKLVEDSKLFITLRNGSRIVSLPGKEGTVRGYSAVDLILIDEAAQVADELYYGIRPMMAVSGGRIVLMSTPFGKRGFFYGEWCGGGSQYDALDVPDSWYRVRVPYDLCPRISREFVANEKERLPDRWFRQEYGCEFLEVEDAAFNSDDIRAAIVPMRPMLEGGPVDRGVKPLFNLK